LEVVKRIIAKEGEDDYGLLSLFLQLRYEPREWFKIPSSCFFPQPDVDSGCVQLVRRKEALLPNEQVGDFQRLVKLGFSARRKMMAKLLKQQWPAEQVTQLWLQWAFRIRPGQKRYHSPICCAYFALKATVCIFWKIDGALTNPTIVSNNLICPPPSQNIGRAGPCSLHFGRWWACRLRFTFS
jgi:hypothetical protein